MKVSELEGVALDEWVARAQGWIDYPTDGIEKGRYWHIDDRAPMGVRIDKCHFKPSTDWAQGGPLLATHPSIIDHAGYTDAWPTGPDLLPFLMRAYVASVFGDEVDA